MGDEDELSRRADAIWNYLRANPSACDTVEGITRWWMAEEDDPHGTQQALDWMVRRGRIDRLVAADGRVRYRLARTDTPAPEG